MNWFVGTYSNSSSFSFHDFHFVLGDWFDTAEFDNSTGGGNGVLNPDWTLGLSIQFPDGGGGTRSTTDPVADQNFITPLVSALSEAETLFITIRRIGWVTFAGNSTV